MDWRNLLFGSSSSKEPKATPNNGGRAAGSYRNDRERVAHEKAAAVVEEYGLAGKGSARAPKAPPVAEKPRGVARPDTSERALRQTAVRDKALRRELTADEWGQLSTSQQQSVRFNTDLLTAHDADEADGGLGGSRKNTRDLVSQLGAPSDAEARILEKLGPGVGPAVRYDDLFGKDGKALGATTTPSMYGGPAEAPVAKRPTTDRQALINSIASSLDGYLTRTDEAKTQAALADGYAKGADYKFESDGAKLDFETAFDALLEKETLGSVPWATALKDFEMAGYDPGDFKKYALDRIQLLPVTADRTSLQELSSWFGN